MVILRRRNESIAAVALSPRWAGIAHRAGRIQREGGVATDGANGVVPTRDAAQRARLHPQCHESSWDLHMFSPCGYMTPTRHGNNQAWLIQADRFIAHTDLPSCYIALKSDHRPVQAWLTQDSFNMHESQGMLAMHPCALSSLDQSLKGIQEGHSYQLGPRQPSSQPAIVQCREQAEMHVRETLAHEEPQIWWHKHIYCMYMTCSRTYRWEVCQCK